MNLKDSTTNPFINIGSGHIVSKDEVLGIFDLDASSTKTDTKRFLSKCESEGHLASAGFDLPKSFVLCTSEKMHICNFMCILTSKKVSSL